MKMMTRKMLATTLTLAMVMPLAVACTKDDKQAEDKGNQQERVLKIATTAMMGSAGEAFFRQQYSDVFQYANPNIKIEIVPALGNMQPGDKMPDVVEKLKELMQGDNPPDVVMFDYNQLSKMVDTNLLTQLDPLITKDKFDTAGIVPAVLDGLKDAGGGKLYALSPTFTSSALIYNKKIFTEAGVDFPKDGMTWDEVFELSKRLGKGEGENRINGFSFETSKSSDLFDGLQTYAAPLQLKMFNDTQDKLAVDTDQWEQVWTKMAKLQKDRVFPDLTDSSKMQMGKSVAIGAGGQIITPYQYDAFMSGKLAMGFMNYGQVQELINANKNAANTQGFTPIDWDVVTIPSHPEAKGVGGSIDMQGVMGINAKAQNPEDAWKFIQFINGDDWAKMKSSSSGSLISRTKYLKPADGQDFHMEAFYSVKPAPMENRYTLGYFPAMEVGRKLFGDVVQGKIKVRDALKQWQTEGDAKMKEFIERIGSGAQGTTSISSGSVKVMPAK